MHKASMRASEIPDEVLRRKQSNKEAMASKRKSNVSVEHVILSFHHDIKNGPDFVCTCLFWPAHLACAEGSALQCCSLS